MVCGVVWCGVWCEVWYGMEGVSGIGIIEHTRTQHTCTNLSVALEDGVQATKESIEALAGILVRATGVT